MFLNTISLLIYLSKTNSSESFSPSSLFTSFNFDLSKENILSPMIYIDEWTWLLGKWRRALEIFPINLTNEGAFSRLVRTTIGVGVSRLYGFVINNEQDELDQKLFQALQMGFYYGIAYALVDGLQDNQNDQHEQIDIDKWLEKIECILCGDQLDSSALPQLPITPLLLETFHSLIQLTSINSITEQTFTDFALLLRSQRSDKNDLENSDYTDIDLFIGPLLKSHFTYTATTFMGGAKNINIHQRLWLMPFLGQLTDDCRDFHEDRQSKSITPVTYYAQHNGLLLNPFFVFLFVCEDIYLENNREKNTGAFLGRRIMRTLRALGEHFKEFLTIFTSTSYPDLYKYILSLEHLFNCISDPEKTIFRYVNKFAKNYSLNHRKLETFAYDYLPLIEKQLSINTDNNNPLICGINHSLKAGGKRLRPLLLLMVTQLYNINIKRVLPLARAIEYLHTSSLIFDDLPAQDNAPLRRGQPTLHMTIDSDQNDIPSSLTEGRAQLAAVDLIAFAIQLVTVGLYQEGFSYESINRVTAELAQSMNELCYGQFLDLQSARIKKNLTIEELDRIAYLKTGKAIEVVLICPVILAEQEQSIDRLRELGQLMGILFQMKDDLLDVEGDTNELGKLKNIDQQNQTITYISLLGIKKTQKRIEMIRKEVEFILNDLWPQAGTIRDVIRYICERQK
jgi:geranylgeranyl pyrophosphate synthase